jgi:hypothetical protein
MSYVGAHPIFLHNNCGARAEQDWLTHAEASQRRPFAALTASGSVRPRVGARSPKTGARGARDDGGRGARLNARWRPSMRSPSRPRVVLERWRSAPRRRHLDARSMKKNSQKIFLAPAREEMGVIVIKAFG